MNNLNKIIRNSKVLEICTLAQSYHQSAILKRNECAKAYEIIEINNFNLNANYKFNFIFSSFNQKIKLSKLNEIKIKIKNSDVIILHSWKGKLWKILLDHSLLLK